MRPAQKTSPVKLHRGGGPVPRPSKRGPGVTGKRPPPKGSSAVKQRKLSPAALRRKRAAGLRKQRRLEAAAANKANSSAVRTDNKQAASDLAKFNAARKRQAKKATPTARRTPKPVGDRKIPVSRRVPFTGTGKPPTARRTAKPVGDRRVPVSRRIRQR
jgi:hypothetical protein